MNIEKYTSLFHDGTIYSIDSTEDQVVISMESAEVDEEDIENDIVLSSNERIRGKLHLEQVSKIFDEQKGDIGDWRMFGDYADIFRFQIKGNNILFSIIWLFHKYDPAKEVFSTVEITSKKIWWENLPEMVVN
ncbi:MAG: hypothetical protein FJZ58_06390 [Chlamydiae bacterium]|nr:hypothetical protein [Chlamydiota bacterium]